MLSVPLMFRIYELYPDHVVFVGVEDEKTKLWSACIMEDKVVDGTVIGDTIYSLDNYVHFTQEGAINYLKFICDNICNNVKVMCN